MMRRGVVRRYWDSNVFIALIRNEAGRAPTVTAILDAAQRSQTQIVTSAFTLVEVIKTPEAGMPLDQSDEALIRRYLERPHIVLAAFGRDTAQRARELIWRHRLSVGDAIHAATALESQVQFLETYDGRFDRLKGHPAAQQVMVREPTWEGDLELDLEQRG